MVILQSMDRFDDLAELDTNTGQLSWFSRRMNPEVSHHIRGAIARMHGRILCLYRRAGILHLKIDDADIELTADTQVNLVRTSEDFNRITVLRDGSLLFDWTYRRPVIEPPLEYDPTPFVEEEHFDFCLFVYHVANNIDRRERIYTESGKSG